MSSAGFETELIPSKPLRRMVLSWSAAALLLGVLLVIGLPVVAWLRVFLGGVWIASCLAERQRFTRGMSRIDRIRMSSDGAVAGFDRDGGRYELTLLPGSVVLGRAAWFRFRFADGLRYGELLLGDALTREQWRRLRLIWRQCA